MDNKTEQKGQRVEPEVVRPGQEFQLFNPEKKSIVLDNFEVLLPLELYTSGFPFNLWSKAEINPFNPSEGYIVTKADLRIETRAAKVRKALEAKEPKLNTVYLSVSSANVTSRTKEEMEVLDKLRLQLFFPNGSSFEGKPTLSVAHGKWEQEEFVTFDIFYPLDTGPLPNQDYLQGIQPAILEGHQIFVPKNKLSEIRAKFVLAEEKPKKVK